MRGKGALILAVAAAIDYLIYLLSSEASLTPIALPSGLALVLLCLALCVAIARWAVARTALLARRRAPTARRSPAARENRRSRLAA